MNGELPLIAVAGGGSAMLAGIHMYERRADEAMRASRVRLALRFPAGLEPVAAFAVLDSFSGLPLGTELVLELVAGEGRIAHFLWVPEAVQASVESMLRAAIPSLRISETPVGDAPGASLAMSFFVPTPALLNPESAVAVSRTLLAGLTDLADETVVLRWALRSGRPRRLPDRTPEGQAAREVDRAWRRKVAQPGMRAAGLLLVRSGSSAQGRVLAAHVESVFRSRRGLAGALRVTFGRGRRTLASLPRTTRTSGWLSSAETLGLIGWPLGPDVPGVEVGAARQLPVPRFVPREGRRLFVGHDAATGAERPVALSVSASSRHLLLVGSTGAGKSSVAGHVVLDGLAAGHGGILIDPKDLASELIDRVPAAYADRVVMFDPAAPGPAIGLDLFGGGDPYLRSDVILSTLRAVSEGWGPRIEQHLRMGLQSVAALERPLLADWLKLYREPELRRQAMARLDDPFLVAEWRAFEALSPAEQFQHSAPAAARVAHLLSRPALRGVLGQRDPKLNVARLLEEGRWLFVSLNSAAIGEPVARLLGSILVFLVWTAIEARAVLSPAMRRPVVLALDELQSLASLPVSLESAFERFRSMNCSVVAATQTAGRLPESLRGSLLGNVGSLVTFRAGGDEAARLARELPGLRADDLLSLRRFEVAARVAVADEAQGHAIVTGRTEPLPPTTGQGRLIRERSIRDYGQPASAPEPQPRPEWVEPGRIGSRRRAV